MFLETVEDIYFDWYNQTPVSQFRSIWFVGDIPFMYLLILRSNIDNNKMCKNLIWLATMFMLCWNQHFTDLLYLHHDADIDSDDGDVVSNSVLTWLIVQKILLHLFGVKALNLK
jgi:hypothetical protein